MSCQRYAKLKYAQCKHTQYEYDETQVVFDVRRVYVIEKIGTIWTGTYEHNDHFNVGFAIQIRYAHIPTAERKANQHNLNKQIEKHANRIFFLQFD